MTASTFFRVLTVVPLAICLCLSLKAQTVKVTLLGTGSPPPVMDRFGPSILVEAGDEKLIFDVGRGSLQRLTQARVRPKDITAIFFTHLHSDHLVGFPDLWLTGWVNGRRDTPLRTYGPKGTVKMMSHLEQAFEFDIKIRLYDDRPSPQGILIEPMDITEGVVYEKNGVKVTAFEVDHEPIKPAFGYRVDFAGRSIVISGDTRVSETLLKHSKGVDLLLHEVVSLESMQSAKYAEDRIRVIMNHHTTPQQAGEIFSKTAPKLAVFYHLVLPTASVKDIIEQTRKTYAGPFEVGEDLMVITIADRVTATRP